MTRKAPRPSPESALAKAARKKTAPPQPAARAAVAQQQPVPTKAATVLAALRQPGGTTIAALTEATDWQPHSVRGFLSGTVRKRLGLALTVKQVDGERRYRLPV